ncbi:ABC transporter permease [Aeromicrobium sp. IC_218]|uniref:ABC transporter permease n=1 Tax=Aeromicrobium sp. IC_218 TaxID=2545468 RepID=UPI001038C676|nr:ABC transporter permease [Aeromicrobium sp. IC_218]TCI96780.1 ABC transporter permease [Aeromicrobium sp. IC_218]
MTTALDRLGTRWRDYVVYLGFVLVFAYFALTQTEYFLTTTNLTNIVVQAAPITVMAVGTVFVLATGEIDLSIGSTVAVAALGSAMVLESTEAWWLAALAGLGIGVLIGAVNGFFITVVRLPSFLVTLATMGLLVGVARQMTDLKSVPVVDDTFVWLFGGGDLLGVSIMVWWTVVVVAVGWHVLRQRRFGAHVLAVGNDARAAGVSGVKVNRVRMGVFMISGAAAALAGVLYSGRLQGARYTLGESDMMSVLAAVIVGGTALAGGKAAMIGALVGSLLMAMINNGLILAGLNVSQQMIVRGVIILVAVSLSLRAKKTV